MLIIGTGIQKGFKEEMNVTHEEPELVKIIDEAVSSTTNSIEALDKIINYKKENGLKSFHISLYPKDEKELDKESVASEIITIMREQASGKIKLVDITNVDL